jgi:hypothetical protein
MPSNADNFHIYSDEILISLIEKFDGTRQQWAAACAKQELRNRGIEC